MAGIVSGSAFDHVMSGSETNIGTYAPSAGSDRGIVIFLHLLVADVSDMPSVTWRGVAMTRAGAITGSQVRTEVWVLPEADWGGSSGDFVLGASGSGGWDAGENHAHAFTVEDVKQALVQLLGDFDSVGASSGAATESLAVDAEDAADLVVAGITTYNTTDITVGAGDGTQWAEQQSGGTVDDSMVQYAGGAAGTYDIQFGGLNTGTNRAYIAIVLRDVNDADLPAIVSVDHDPASTNSANAGPTAAIDKDDAGGLADAATGDLVVVVVTYRGTTGTLSVGTTGGQTWNQSGSQLNDGNLRTAVFWCIFNGTWSADPVFTIGSGTNAIIASAVVIAAGTFDPDDPMDVDMGDGGSHTANTAYQIPTWSTATDNALAFNAWITEDNNTISAIQGGWTGIDAGNSWRVTTTTGLLHCITYKRMPTAGAVGTWDGTQSGSDPGHAIYFAIKPPSTVSDQTLNGTSASVSVSAPSGNLAPGLVSLAGSPASVSASAPEGVLTSLATLAGSPAPVSVGAPSGTLTPGLSTLLGNPADVTAAATAGTLAPGLAILEGSPAPVTVQAPDGVLTALATLQGSPAAVAVEAPAGSLAPGTATLQGSPASVSAEATAGSLAPGTVVLSGSPASVSAEATAGSLTPGTVVLSGSPASVSVSAPSGDLIAAGGAQTLNGSPASVSVSAPEGTLSPGSTSLSGAPASVSISASTGVLTSTAVLGGFPAEVSAAAPTGSLVPGVAALLGSPAEVVVQSPSGTIVSLAILLGSPAEVVVAAPSGAIFGTAILFGSPAAVTVSAPSGVLSLDVIILSGGDPASVAVAATTGALIPLNDPTEFDLEARPLATELVDEFGKFVTFVAPGGNVVKKVV